MFCEYCGEQMNDNALTCPKCGAAVASQVPLPQYQQPAYQQPIYQQPPYQQQNYQQQQYQQPQYQQVFTNQAPQSDHSLFGWYAAVLKKYADFSGRARRKEYWMFYLCNFLITIIPTAILYYYLIISYKDMIYYNANNFGYMSNNSGYIPTTGFGAMYYICIILLSVYGLAVFLPGIALTVRRLHDIGKSGGWVFISFVPYIGAIWLFVLMVTPGYVGPNFYGNDPKDYSGNSFPNYPNTY